VRRCVAVGVDVSDRPQSLRPRVRREGRILSGSHETSCSVCSVLVFGSVEVRTTAAVSGLHTAVVRCLVSSAVFLRFEFASED
jgi:hypothetical protein